MRIYAAYIRVRTPLIYAYIRGEYMRIFETNIRVASNICLFTQNFILDHSTSMPAVIEVYWGWILYQNHRLTYSKSHVLLFSLDFFKFECMIRAPLYTSKY